MEGRNVRLSGEDVGRGTFSHRHVMLVDQKTEAIHIPLNSIHPEQKGFLEVSKSNSSKDLIRTMKLQNFQPSERLNSFQITSVKIVPL